MGILDMNDQRSIATPSLFAGADVPFAPVLERLPESEGGMRLGEFFDILRRRARLIAAIAVCGTICVGIAAWFLPPRYTAKAQIVVEESQAPRIDGRAPNREAGADQGTIQTEVTSMSSRDLLANVIARLSADPEFQAIRPHADANPLSIEELERHLKVFQEAGSHVIAVTYDSRKPAESSVIANGIAEYYLARGENQSRFALDQALAGLNGKIAELRSESLALDARVTAYQLAHGVKDAAKVNVIDQKLGDLNHQLAAVQSDFAVRKARYTALLAARGPAGDWDGLLSGLDAQGLVDLHGQVMGVLASRRDNIIMPPVTGSHVEGAPRVLRDKVRKELDQALVKLSGDADAASVLVEAAEQRLGSVQSASDDTGLRDLVTSAASSRRRYERLVTRRDELLEQRDDVAGSARMLSRAAIPDRPSSLNPLLFLAPGGIACLVLGCLTALVRDRLDQGIYTEADIASVLGLRCIGLVPRSRHLEASAAARAVKLPLWCPRPDAAASIVNRPRPVSVAAPPGGRDKSASFTEALRGLMVSLQLMGPHGRAPRVILVTSSVPGEGKTTLAVSLATCAAQNGARVLVLDMDCRDDASHGEAPLARPPYAKTARDVLDLLALDRTQGDFVPMASGAGALGLAVPGMHLDYLPVRRGRGADPLPLFSRDQMSLLLQRLRGDYDQIFIDSAPVLAKAEVRLLAAIADQTVFAVRWGKTRRDDASAALALLRGMGVGGGMGNGGGAISAVITQVDLARHARGHRGDQSVSLAKYGSHYPA